MPARDRSGHRLPPARARVADLARADLDGALYADRTLIKHLSMRRTLFVFSRELLAAATAGPGARVADSERRRTIREIEASAVASDGLRWLGDAEAAVLAALESHPDLTSSQLREAAPIVDVKMRVGGAGKWGTDAPVGPRLLTILSAAGLAVRGNNRGGWTSTPRCGLRWRIGWARPRPHGCRCWHCQMTQAWLHALGAGARQDDLKWWLGVRQRDRQTRFDRRSGHRGRSRWRRSNILLPDNTDPVVEVEPWVALLPALDPTPMGPAHRDWYLGPHRAVLLDSTAMPGPTAWWNRHVVGGWHQEPSGR